MKSAMGSLKSDVSNFDFFSLANAFVMELSVMILKNNSYKMLFHFTCI